MMRQLLSLFALLVITNLVAQDYSPRWGSPQKLPGGFNTPMYNLGIMNGDYYLSFVKGPTNTILRYDLNHKFKGKQEGVVEKGKKNLAIREILHTSAGYFGFSGYYNSKKKTYSLVAYDMEAGKFKNRRKIFSQDLQLSGLRSASGGRFSLLAGRSASQLGLPLSDFVMSADSNTLAFHNLVSDRNHFAKDRIMVGLFDNSLNMQWKKKQELDYQDRDLSIVQAAVTVRGEIFILAKLFERKRKKDRRLPRYDYKLFRITKEDFEEFDIKLNRDNAPTDAGLFIPPSEDQVIVGGLYTNSDRRGGLLGSFLFRLDLTNGDNGSKLYAFKPRDLENIVPKGRIRRNKGLDENRYEIKDFISFSNGSMAIVTEATWLTQVSIPSPNGGFSQQTTFHSDAIVMPTFTADGELEKVGVIDKYYASGTALNQSYGIGWDSGKAFLLYNDYKRGAERKEIGGKRGSIYTDMTVFSNFGETIYQGTIFNNRDIRSIFTPRLTSFREGKIMVVGLRSGRYQIGLIDLE